MYTSSLRSQNSKSGKISGKIRHCAPLSLGLQEEHTDWCVTFSCKVQLQKNCIMSGIHFLPYILCLFFKKDFEKPWRTSSRFVWFSEVLRFKATLRGDALLFWYASWSHTKSHLVTLTAIPITHRKWSGQKEYFTQNPKGRIWDLNRLRYFSDDAVFWLLHNYSRTFQITYLLCTNVQNTKYALLMNLPDICWLILR